MYYINSTPNTVCNYGNPMGQPFEDCLALPDALLGAYIEARGFILPTIEDGEVTTLETNQEALDAYLAEHPDVEPVEEPTLEERMTAMETAIQTGLTMYEEDLGNG